MVYNNCVIQIAPGHSLIATSGQQTNTLFENTTDNTITAVLTVKTEPAELDAAPGDGASVGR